VQLSTAPVAPWQNRYVARVLGSIRRELLGHVIVFDKQHLKRLLSCHFDYYHRWRTHRSLDMDVPNGQAVESTESGPVVEFPVVQGLHHYYLQRLPE
jgi:hypothetical protein